VKRLVEKDIQFLYSESQQDKLVTGKMVLNIQDFEISSFSMDTRKSFQNIILEFKEKGVEFISIRSKQNFNVSRILSENGFTYIETLYKPFLRIGKKLNCDLNVNISEVLEKDLEKIKIIASSSFVNDRFHFDNRFKNDVGNKRYSLWVENSFFNKKYNLLKITFDNEIIGFFIVEYIKEKNVYWHLTAIDNKFQGRGLGYNVWKGMINKHQIDGYLSVETAISSNNLAALNLYSKLNFKIMKGFNTYHKFLQ
jgi:ribosomal protein S18 acetylase RimI-like enzyme